MIKDKPVAAITGLTADPNVIREDNGETTVTLKITLETALPDPETVAILIEDIVEIIPRCRWG